MSDNFKGKPFDIGGAPRYGEVAWRSPSNIALIKYWGKHGIQLPRNPSLSFSLSNAYTDTQVAYTTRETSSKTATFEFFFEGKRNEPFARRIQSYLDSIIVYFSFLKNMDLKIQSQNSFPHSSGIASSASSMSALALCLMDIEYELMGRDRDDAFLNKASFIARLGSGSASRSVHGDFCVWGTTSLDERYTDEYAVPLNSVHASFQGMHDDILIVSATEKSVSSTAGHKLMNNNPFAEIRYVEARRKLIGLASIIKNGDLEAFGKIVEEEALSLHALMMCSDPSFVLMEPNSLKIINEIRAFRTQTKTPVFFTLDAGPNVHVIYPNSVSERAREFVEGSLLQYCEEGQHIYDRMGDGPRKIIYSNKN